MADIFKNRAVASEPMHTQVYRNFKGVDLSSAITEVDPARSPAAPNMIANLSGFPQKRTGTLTIGNFALGGRINGLFCFITAQNSKIMIVHAGTKIYIMQPKTQAPNSVYYPEDCTPQVLFSGANDARSISFCYDGKLYILDGKNYIVYNGTGNFEHVEANAYIPTTAIAMLPSGGGEDFEPINLLQPQRINSYKGTADATSYQLDAQSITSVIKCEKMIEGGTWQNISAYSVDLANGKVVFASAPGVSVVQGDDNVRITFSKVVSGYAERIKNCTITSMYGIGNDNRIFVSGNAAYRNYDWFCWSGRADYFPDISYNIVGSETTAIMGYLQQYENMIVVKEQNGLDVSTFLRSATMNAENKALFLTKQGLAGIGAVSKYCFATIADDNVFLSSDGVFGFDSMAVTMQKTTQLRSYYVNYELTAERNLKEAFAICKNGYYYLFVNSHVYVADSRQKNVNPNKSFGYEWFYWTDISARCAIEFGGTLYIGDEKMKKMKNESEYGKEAYSDDDKAIYASWATKMDFLGDSSVFKKISKTGTGIIAMPFEAATGKIYYLSDEQKLVKEFSINTEFDFSNIDFDNIDFGSLPYPMFIPTGKSERNVRMLQIIVENDVINEGFGLYEIRVKYQYTKNIKR